MSSKPLSRVSNLLLLKLGNFMANILRGPRGEPGPRGLKGDQGIQGPIGPDGPRGARGPVGLDLGTIPNWVSIMSGLDRDILLGRMTPSHFRDFRDAGQWITTNFADGDSGILGVYPLGYLQYFGPESEDTGHALMLQSDGLQSQGIPGYDTLGLPGGEVVDFGKTIVLSGVSQVDMDNNKTGAFLVRLEADDSDFLGAVTTIDVEESYVAELAGTEVTLNLSISPLSGIYDSCVEGVRMRLQNTADPSIFMEGVLSDVGFTDDVVSSLTFRVETSGGVGTGDGFWKLGKVSVNSIGFRQSTLLHTPYRYEMVVCKDGVETVTTADIEGGSAAVRVRWTVVARDGAARLFINDTLVATLESGGPDAEVEALGRVVILFHQHAVNPEGETVKAEFWNGHLWFPEL